MNKIALELSFKEIQSRTLSVFKQDSYRVYLPDGEDNHRSLNTMILNLLEAEDREQNRFFRYYSYINLYIRYRWYINSGDLKAFLEVINCIFAEDSMITNVQAVNTDSTSPVIVVNQRRSGYTGREILLAKPALAELINGDDVDKMLQREFEMIMGVYLGLYRQISMLDPLEVLDMLETAWEVLRLTYPKNKLNEFGFREKAANMMVDDSDQSQHKEEEQMSVVLKNDNTQEIVAVKDEEKKLADVIVLSNTIQEEVVDEEKELADVIVLNNIIEEVIDDEDENDVDDVDEMETEMEINSQSYISNRQLSWLKFNDRVLSQSEDIDTPLFERLRFIGITSNNLDEFFMVRVGSVLCQIHAGSDVPDSSGLTPYEEYCSIINATRDFYKRQYDVYSGIVESNKDIFQFMKYKELDEESKKIADEWFEDKIYLSLTPHVIDEGKPFPIISSKSLNIAVLLTDIHRVYNFLGIIKVPTNISRLVPIDESTKTYILVEDLILNNLDKVFKNKKIKKRAIFRVVRNADVPVDNNSTGYITTKMKETLFQREIEEVVRLEVSSNSKKELTRLLQSSFNISKKETYHVKTPLDLTFLMDLGWKDKKHVYPKFEPQVSKYLAGERSIFEAIDDRDIILHHPYESFQPVLDFVNSAANDPDVVAIKQTLYRVSSDSPLMHSLMLAAKQGKSVTVLFEVKARFDERANLEWAEKLEKAGGHVIYGASGLKTHCKLLLVIKKNKKGNLKPYIHLGTGNYNEKTASAYTDYSFFTSNKKLCEEAIDIFNMLTGFSEPGLKRLICSPFDLRKYLIKMIQNEIDNVINFPDKEHYITFKVNSLTDKEIIEKLYDASSAGVKINLIVRGMCLMNTSLPQAANINVRSIIGRFLEHSRVYIFSNNGEDEIYLSSADVMERNLDKRFEIMFPIKDKNIKKDINHTIDLMLGDDIKRYELNGFNYNKIAGKDTQTILMKKHEKIGEELNVEKIYY